MLDGIVRYKLRLEFIEMLLGTAPLNAEIYTDFVASKAPATNGNGNGASELDTLEALDIKGRTGFHRDEAGNPLLLDYMFRGFCKEACGALRQQRNRKSAALTNYKSKINAHLFVAERYIPLKLPHAATVTNFERPLRAETMRGPRVALASSDSVPIGTWCEFTLEVLAPEIITEPLLTEWLDYGRFVGIGQWRSGSHGRFVYRLRKLDA